MNRHATTQQSRDPYFIIAYQLIQERFDEADQYRLTHPHRNPYLIRALRRIQVRLQAVCHSLVVHPLWEHGAGRVG